MGTPKHLEKFNQYILWLRGSKASLGVEGADGDLNEDNIGIK